MTVYYGGNRAIAEGRKNRGLESILIVATRNGGLINDNSFLGIDHVPKDTEQLKYFVEASDAKFIPAPNQDGFSRDSFLKAYQDKITNNIATIKAHASTLTVYGLSADEVINGHCTKEQLEAINAAAKIAAETCGVKFQEADLTILKTKSVNVATTPSLPINKSYVSDLDTSILKVNLSSNLLPSAVSTSANHIKSPAAASAVNTKQKPGTPIVHPDHANGSTRQNVSQDVARHDNFLKAFSRTFNKFVLGKPPSSEQSTAHDEGRALTSKGLSKPQEHEHATVKPILTAYNPPANPGRGPH